jgi:hypothetical protein
LEHAHTLLAVGWLTNDQPYRTGPIDFEVFSKLKDLLNDPWQPMVCCGVHHCELCQFEPPHGHANLFVPGSSIIFVCPELITHYIAAHHYRPPDEFIAAVAACPETRTMQYKKKFLECGGRGLVARSV